MLPAAATLKKQGANNGATAAFLISTPESGVDSISITWALLDPIMTVARPVAAFFTAMVAGISENLFTSPIKNDIIKPVQGCTIDNCCDGIDCPPEVHKRHHSPVEKFFKGLHFGAFDLWSELVGWFFIGILIAGLVTVAVPDDLIGRHLGGGLPSMLLILAVGIPLYICATASTPIAAAMILKGVSPGTALVFLLAGPATNVTSLSVLVGILGKRAAGLYLGSIALVSVICGLLLDAIYLGLGIQAAARIGQAAEVIPEWLMTGAGLLLLLLSIRPLYNIISGWFNPSNSDCGCSTGECGTTPSIPMAPLPPHDDSSCSCSSKKPHSHQ